MGVTVLLHATSFHFYYCSCCRRCHLKANNEQAATLRAHSLAIILVLFCLAYLHRHCSFVAWCITTTTTTETKTAKTLMCISRRKRYYRKAEQMCWSFRTFAAAQWAGSECLAQSSSSKAPHHTWLALECEITWIGSDFGGVECSMGFCFICEPLQSLSQWCATSCSYLSSLWLMLGLSVKSSSSWCGLEISVKIKGPSK